MLLSSSSPDYWWTSLPYLVIASTKTFFRHSNHFHFLWYLLIQSYCFGVVRSWGWQLASWNPDSQICKLGSVPFLLVTCFALWHDFLSKGTSGLLFACSCTGHPNDFFFNSAKNEHLRSYWDPMDPHKGAGQSCQSLDSHMDTDLWLTIPPSQPPPSLPWLLTKPLESPTWFRALQTCPASPTSVTLSSRVVIWNWVSVNWGCMYN